LLVRQRKDSLGNKRASGDNVTRSSTAVSACFDGMSQQSSHRGCGFPLGSQACSAMGALSAFRPRQSWLWRAPVPILQNASVSKARSSTCALFVRICHGLCPFVACGLRLRLLLGEAREDCVRAVRQQGGCGKSTPSGSLPPGLHCRGLSALVAHVPRSAS